MWQYDSEVNWKRRYQWLYIIFHITYPICYIYGGLVSVDLNESVFSIACGLTALVETVKLACILLKQNEIRQFMLDVCSHSLNSREVFMEITNKLNNLISFSVALLAMTSLAVINTIVLYLPMFSSTTRLPLNMWFPIDLENNEIVFWMAYLYTGAALVICGLSVTLNIILWYIMMNCAVKYRLIGMQFSDVIATELTNSKADFELIVLDGFIRSIESHQKLRK